MQWKEQGGSTLLEVLTAADRSKVIGTSIPSGPAVVILRDDPKVLVGGEGGVSTQDATETKAFHRYFWQQLQ